MFVPTDVMAPLPALALLIGDQLVGELGARLPDSFSNTRMRPQVDTVTLVMVHKFSTMASQSPRILN